MNRPLPPCPVPDDELPLYRNYTLVLLHRYYRQSIDIGRLPSLLGREFFRARCTSYRAHSFEDVVIFVHDVERCLERLDTLSQRVVALVVLQGHSEEAAARLLKCSDRTIRNQYPTALDAISRMFLIGDLLTPIPHIRRRAVKNLAAAEPEAPSPQSDAESLPEEALLKSTDDDADGPPLTLLACTDSSLRSAAFPA